MSSEENQLPEFMEKIKIPVLSIVVILFVGLMIIEFTYTGGFNCLLENKFGIETDCGGYNPGGLEQPTEEVAVVEESVEKKKPTESEKSNEPIRAVDRKIKFTNKQMSGTFQGSQNIMDVTTAATVININIDGTFTYKDYIGSEFNGEGKGKYEIVMETEEEKDPFGQVTGTTYYHGIYFNSETEYGIRTSIYRIIDTDLLLPLKTTYFANQEAVMERKK